MTLYYVKQDNMGWCCEADSGPYYEDHEESFVDCECELPDNAMTAEHLQDCNGGGLVIEWRSATSNELSAHESGRYDGYNDGFSFGREREREVIIALLDAEHSEYTYQHQENKGAYIDDCPACFAIAIIKGEN